MNIIRVYRKTTGSESILKLKCNNKNDRPRKYSILLTSIKNCRKSTVPIQTRHTNGRPSDISVKMLKNEIEILKNSILKVGKWPVSKSELTNRNLKQLIRYIKSMDLEKINHSNEKI